MNFNTDPPVPVSPTPGHTLLSQASALSPLLLFDGKHGESNGGVLKPELFIQDVDVEGPLPDDGSQPRSHY